MDRLIASFIRRWEVPRMGAAGAVVREDVPAYVIAARTPAQVAGCRGAG